VNSHNAHAHHHAVSRDEILFHPDHHFYFQGLKFVALSTLRAMKARRAEGKDLKDVAAIDQLLGAEPAPATPAVATPSTSVQTPASPAHPTRPGQPRIIGLVPARNEAGRLPFCLRALARFTDAIVYLDDFSDDDSVRVVEAVAAECRVERILTKKVWNRDEPGDRNALLEAGRQLGGTHFIVLDADEAFTANCQTDGVLRREIQGLLPGDRLVLTWIQLWRGLGQYRFDQSVWTNNRKAFAFADDGSCSYSSEFIHTPRVPGNLKGRAVTVPGYGRGVLHFQFVHWPNLQIKQSWYRCMERVRFPERPATEINKRYAPSEDETNLQTRPVPPDWFQGHPPMDESSLRQTDERRVREVLHWFDTLGRQTFADLDVWRVDWESLRQSLQAPPPPAPQPAIQKPATAKPSRTSTAVDSCLRQADKYFQEGKLIEAHSWLERVLDLDPDAADVWIASGNVLLQLGDFTNGIQSIQRAADLRPDHAPTLAALAAACVQAGRIEDFEKALGTALSINPSEPSAVRLLADLNFRSGQFQDAAHGYHQLIQQNGNDIQALLALGVCFAKTGDPETARAAFNEVLRVDPRHAIALENLSALGTPATSPTHPAPAPAPTSVSAGSPAAAVEQPATPTPAANAPADAKPPLISAIISTYKSERYLRGCLQDLLQQTIADRLEIIVIDSGSPENERAIVEEFQSRHPRIVYVRTERESIYGAWNRAVRLATAPYLTSANADDRHRPEALERLVATLEAHPECALAYADCAVCEHVHPDFGFTELRGYYRWPNFDPVLLFRGCYVGPQPVWRRSLHDRYGLFDPSYRSAGDYEFWLRLAKTETFFHLPEVLGLHWYAEESLGHQNRELTRQESDHARILHWPSKWGARPTQTFKTLHLIPAVEKQQQRNRELAARVETLEREKARLTSEVKRLATESPIAPAAPAPSAKAATTPLETPAPIAATPAASAHLESLTVPATSLLPTDTNPEAFQHLLRGFDLIRENRFEEAQVEARNYRDKVVYDALRRVDHRTGNTPALTVVVVAHQTRQALLRCLDSLAHPSNPDHEVIVVDNGGNESIEAELQSRPLLHVLTPVNVLPSEARNIGVHFARASIVVFVDDDATVAPGYLASILAAFDAYEMVGFRGKVLPQSDHQHNDRVRHYDLGDVPITANLNTEGNCAVRVAVWKQVGGQDPLLFGGEGVELSFRITARFGPSAILYWPSAVIYHDYAEDDSKLDRKSERHRAARAYLEWKHTGILEHHEFLRLPPRTDDERLQRTLPLRPRQAAAQAEPCLPETKPQAPIKSVVVDSPIAALRSALSFRGWMAKFDAYAAKLKSLEYIPSRLDPAISIVIIAHEIRVDSIRVLQKLQEDRDGRFEIVYVLNGSRTVEADQVRPYVDTLVQLTENTGAYFARNVGAAFAKAGILFFLDDDAIPERGCVAAHLDEFQRFDVIAVRGAIFPKTQNPLNELAKHYYLGDRRFPIHADVEGNTSYLAKPFFAVGGWDDEIVFGGGGIDLAFRLLQVESDRRRQIYSPVPVVYHDYAANEEHLARKHKKQAESRERLYRKHPRFEALRTAWQSFFGKEHLVLPKTPTDLHPTAAADPSAQPHAPVPAPTSAVDDFTPLITVAIPTFNRARFLQEAVQSALHQTYPHLEVVIVDDGSTDETDSLLRTFCDPRVRCFTKEHSGGPATRNRCVQEAHGDYIVWLDSDDFLLADTVALYVAELRRNPELDVLYGNLLVADEQLRVQEVWTYHDYHGWTECLISDSTIENRLPNVGTLVRKTCYQRFGLYNPEFPRAHDYEFWTRAVAGAVVKSMRTEVAIYRRHEDSLTQLRKPADTRYEANAVKALISRHALNILFPFCYAAGAPVATGNARAWSLASLLMAKYGDVPAALTYARRSVEAADLGQNAQLLGILEALDGRVNTSSKSKAPTSDEFTTLVDTARRQFAAGKVHPCAKACARLAEIRPEAPETLLLSAMSLRRWGSPSDAQAAYHCLVHRQCGLSFLGASRDADATRAEPRQASPSDARPVLVQRLIQRLGAVLGPEPIPDAAIRSALDYLTQASSASSIPGFLALHRHGQTPLFFAILGVLDEELDPASDPALSRAVTLVRAGLQPAPTPASARRPGYSFCIITGGSRPDKVARQIASIRALGLDHFEILVGGNVTDVPEDVRKVDLAAAAKAGRLGKMRNALGRLAAFDHLVVSDDDIVFDPGFAEGLKRFGEGYDIMAVRILNTDGSRFWDWATTGGLKGSVLLDYWESDPNVYVTGGICVLQTATLDRVGWDESRGFYQREDVDFSSRLKAAGFTIRYNPFSVVLHDDDRYSRVGRVVYQFDHLLGEAVQNQTTRGAAETRHFLNEAWRIAGSYPERQAAVQTVARRLGITLDFAAVPTSAPAVPSPSPVAAPSPAPTQPMRVGQEAMVIDWIGSFLDHGSLSHVNRELTRALRERPEAKVHCIGETSRLPKNAPKAWTSLAGQMAPKPSRHAKVTIRHAWPPQWNRPQSGALVVIQPWEFGSLPRSWVNDLAQVDEVWIPSEYVRQVYLDSGVPADKVFVVPNGIDPSRFHPGVAPMALATRKSFKFLFVGGTIYRKGPDLLLEAFMTQFTADDDVCLVIKDFGGKDVYAGQTFEQRIRAAQAQPNAPEILYLNEELPPESIPGLYTACDCLVHPYRGEGFGLPVLEAMACGLPVIVTAGGATDDFAPEQIAIRIPATRKEIGTSISGMPLVRSGWLLEPDLGVLSSRMRWVHDHQEEARSRGTAGSEHVHANWTWNHAAAAALLRAQTLAAKPPITSAARPNPPRSGAIELPTCARVGHLGTAHELFEKKKYRESWEATLEALQRRPYHPEAYLLLGEIAKAVGDASSARRFGQQAKAIAPQWKPAKSFLKGHAHGNSRPTWLALPPELAETGPAERCRLSVCLIVKNEEQFLAPCLQSIQSIASEIIVVDTGSTDRTIEIAREFGAQVHSFVWCDDFSAARNAALEHATGDWVLMLDADEQLPPQQHDNLRRDFKKPGILGLRIPLQNIGAEAEGVAYVPRLFRNAPGLFYVSRIHEQVFSSILVRAEEWGLDTALGTAQIQHYGYTKELVKARNKSQRNLRLLREAVQEFPGDANLLMNLGLESVHNGDLESGIDDYERAYQALCAHPEQQRVPELRETLLTQYASALMKAGRYAEIVRILESPVAKAYEPTASIHFALGLAYFRLERPAAAAAQIKECLAKRHLPTASPINPEIRKAGPYHCLGLCLIHAGQFTEAEAAFRAALRDESSSRGVRLDLARLYRRMARPIDALKVLHELIDTRQGDPEVWRLGGEIALSTPSLLDFAIDWTGEARKAHPTQTLLAGQHGEALLISGNPGAAIPFLRASAVAGDACHSAALCLSELATNLRPSPVPAHLEQEVSAQFLRWFQRITSSPGSGMLHQVIEEIRPLEKVLPTAAAKLRTALTEAA
jgi:glycosyltransferase involved in cell wall biosynthesis/Flp pilus assembly protein TadD